MATPQAPNSLFVSSDIDTPSLSFHSTQLRNTSQHATASAIHEIQPHNFDELSTMPITSACLDATVRLSQPASTMEPDLPSHALQPWKIGKLTSAKLDKFAEKVLPPAIQAALRTTFGKDSIRHSFYAEKTFRHVLLPVLKSGFLPLRATKALERASRHARTLQLLRKNTGP